MKIVCPCRNLRLGKTARDAENRSRAEVLITSDPHTLTLWKGLLIMEINGKSIWTKASPLASHAILWIALARFFTVFIFIGQTFPLLAFTSH